MGELQINPSLQLPYFPDVGHDVGPNVGLTPRSFGQVTEATSWEEIWEAGPYYDRIAGVLEQARDYAIFVGWQVDSRLPLRHPSAGFETLKQKVIRLCDQKPGFHIYFLIWDHAYFYILEREVWQSRVWNHIHPQIHFIFDNHHAYGGSHHEKICIIDGKTAFCGGIDLCDERWDSPQHLFNDPRRSLNWRHEHHGPYHDMAVQVTGPVCSDIQRHIARRWKARSPIRFPVPAFPTPSNRMPLLHEHRVYISRTRVNVDAHGEKKDGDRVITREIEFLFRDLIRSARRRIILEGQYYWSREVNDLLIAKVLEMRNTGFELYLILTDLRRLKFLARQMSSHQLTLLHQLQVAAEHANVKFTLGTPYVFPPEHSDLKPKSIYIHSKVLVIDDRYLSVGSANFAARALRIDTEINLTLEAKSESERLHILNTGNRILDHWNIRNNRGIGGIQFRQFNPLTELSELKRSRHLLTWVPWRVFFDPEIPWFFPLKLWTLKVLRRLKLLKLRLRLGRR